MRLHTNFITAKRRQHVTTLLLQRHGQQGSYKLVLVRELPKGNTKELEYTESEVHVSVSQFSNTTYRTIQNVNFHMDVDSWKGSGHIRTFLNAIKPTSEVLFRIITGNTNNNMTDIGWTAHTLYGEVDGNPYLLSSYVGPDNLASPVQF